MRPSQMTKEEALKRLREYYQKHGSWPKLPDFPTHGLPSKSYLDWNFGSVPDAMLQAGVPQIPNGPHKISEKELLEFLREACRQLGCYPRRWSHLRGLVDIPHAETFRNHFGNDGLSDALRLAGIDTVHLPAAIRWKGKIIPFEHPPVEFGSLL